MCLWRPIYHDTNRVAYGLISRLPIDIKFRIFRTSNLFPHFTQWLARSGPGLCPTRPGSDPSRPTSLTQGGVCGT